MMPPISEMDFSNINDYYQASSVTMNDLRTDIVGLEHKIDENVFLQKFYVGREVQQPSHIPNLIWLVVTD